MSGDQEWQLQIIEGGKKHLKKNPQKPVNPDIRYPIRQMWGKMLTLGLWLPHYLLDWQLGGSEWPSSYLPIKYQWPWTDLFAVW